MVLTRCHMVLAHDEVAMPQPEANLPYAVMSASRSSPYRVARESHCFGLSARLVVLEPVPWSSEWLHHKFIALERPRADIPKPVILITLMGKGQDMPRDADIFVASLQKSELWDLYMSPVFFTHCNLDHPTAAFLEHRSASPRIVH